jgi:hypothetical protein
MRNAEWSHRSHRNQQINTDGNKPYDGSARTVGFAALKRRSSGRAPFDCAQDRLRDAHLRRAEP